mgnify:CR=1 FL=1
MKLCINKLHYLFLVLVIISASCTDDEDPNRRDMLIGTWEIQSGELVDYSVQVSGVILNRSQIQNSALLLAGLGVDVGELDQDLEDAANVVFPAGTTVSFAENNDYTFTSSDGTDSGTWSLSDDEETIILDVANELGLNQLNLAIESLTNQQISLLFSVSRADVDLQALGVDELPDEIEDFTIEYRFQFIKQ